MSEKVKFLLFWGIPLTLYILVRLDVIPAELIWIAIFVLVLGFVVDYALVPFIGIVAAVVFIGLFEMAMRTPPPVINPTPVATATLPPPDCGRTGFEVIELEVGQVIDNEGPTEIYFFVQDWRVYIPLPTGMPGPAYSSVPGTFVYVWDERCSPETIRDFEPEGNIFILGEWGDVIYLGWLVAVPEPAPAQK